MTSTPSDDQELLAIRGLNVYYGESHILRDVDLSVRPGQMACLIGLNGVGKTTLLKTIIGLLRQRSGSIHLDGRDLGAQPPHERARGGVGYVPQGREIIPQLTVRENLLLGLEAREGGIRRHRHIDPLVFELFPILERFLNRRGGDLSGGQQQQLAIARALLGRPRLLLLDEPTEGIQPSVVLDIQRAVARILRETGIGVLLVEHHASFVRQSDWYYAMQKGGVVASGATAQLSQDTLQRFLSV
ncbi:MAG: urea ABC transporter ATP-binding subunit UrtE [Cyanobacteriota bacterium]|jgi:urea transport system ATP-binding protein|nr:urea ABC transporter ATP-binding subunit UrtE [Synechococcus sp. Tobar2m-G35]MEB3238935.1 urea ABC transporter ATP-binding subunit UrtE [Cyanobacteriota bacterium]